MTQTLDQENWENESIILDDVPFDENDAKQFRSLLGIGENSGESEHMAPGSILNGEVVEVTKDYVVVDVGLKSEGLVSVDEFSAESELELGASIEVFLDQLEDENGQIVLSKEKAIRQRQWENILTNHGEGAIIQGSVLRKVKGGLIVDIGVEAFLPGSQVDTKRIKNLDDYIGHKFDFKVLKINEERKNIVVSRRELLEAERLSKKAELLDTLKVGDLRTGMVKNITDFGVFLDLNGIDGLLHITDMSWKRIRHPSEMVDFGQEIEVMILNIDEEKGRVALGYKQKYPNPWEEIEQKYPPGTQVSGKVVNLVPYGAFLEIEPGIEGLIHVSEMSWVKTITDPSDMVSKGQDVSAVVLSVQKEEGKISLGLKQLERNPWDDIEAKYPVGSEVRAEVKSLTNYGAFVELEPGVEGLIHISDLSWTKKVSHPSEVLNKGDAVVSIILSVDKESRKITLGVKQLSSNPWKVIEDQIPVGTVVKGKITKITAFGAFVEIQTDEDLKIEDSESGIIEGLIHVTELSDQPIGKVEDIANIGDEVTAKVVKLDPEHKRISLSIKECLADQSQDDIIVSSE